jgi:hypothetical protein
LNKRIESLENKWFYFLNFILFYRKVYILFLS